MAISTALALGACNKPKDEPKEDEPIEETTNEEIADEVEASEYEGTLLVAHEQRIVLAGDQGDMEFVTSADTLYDMGDYGAMYLDDIVAVTYHEDGDGLCADKITLVEHMETPLEFAGELVGQGVNYITLANENLSATFMIDDNTYLVGELSQGDKIELTYLGNLNEFPYANVVAVVEEAKEEPKESTVHGVVSELSGRTVLISIDSAHAYRFNITEKTEISGAASHIALGDTVDVTFKGSIESQPDALSVKVAKTAVGTTYVIKGTVKSVENGVVTLDTGAATYKFSTNNDTKYSGEKPAKGYLAVITYTLDSNGNSKALAIYCEKSAEEASKKAANEADGRKGGGKKDEATVPEKEESRSSDGKKDEGTVPEKDESKSSDGKAEPEPAPTPEPTPEPSTTSRPRPTPEHARADPRARSHAGAHARADPGAHARAHPGTHAGARRPSPRPSPRPSRPPSPRRSRSPSRPPSPRPSRSLILPWSDRAPSSRSPSPTRTARVRGPSRSR